MTKLTDKKLLNLITYAPASIVAVFTLFWVFLTARDVILNSEEQLRALRQEHEQQQHSTLTSRVEYVEQQISYARAQTEAQLESTIKEQIYQAHNIATRIYENNKHARSNSDQAHY